jgi:hypothetical protein
LPARRSPDSSRSPRRCGTRGAERPLLQEGELRKGISLGDAAEIEAERCCLLLDRGRRQNAKVKGQRAKVKGQRLGDQVLGY